MGKIDIHIPSLVFDYEVGEAAAALARRHKVNIWSVIDRLKKAGVRIRSLKEVVEVRLGPSVTTEWSFKELVDGILLGDGHIDAKNSLHLNQENSRMGWLTQLQGQLSQVGCSSKLLPLPSRQCKIEGREVTSKPGTLLYTPSYVEMAAERVRWVVNGVKRVPKNLTMTPILVAQWFAGDGSYGKDGQLVFHTNGFAQEDTEFLVSRLSTDLGVHATIMKTPRPGQFTVGVNQKDQALKLAALVRPHLAECCRYKLAHVRPSLIPWATPDEVRAIRSRYDAGETAAAIAVDMDYSATTIQNIAARRSHKKVI